MRPQAEISRISWHLAEVETGLPNVFPDYSTSLFMSLSRLTSLAIVASLMALAPASMSEEIDARYEIRSAALSPPPVTIPAWKNPLPASALEPLRHDLTEFLRLHPAKDSHLPLIYQAVVQGDADHLDALLDRGLDPNEKTFGGDTALCAAIRFGDIEAVRKLLLRGADPHLAGAESQPPIALASLRRPVSLITALLAAGAEPDAHFSSPADKRLLDSIITRDLKNSLASDRGVTPLMACAARGDVEGAVALMRAGAKTSTCTKKYKRYPLNFAATQQYLFLMRVLLGRDPESEPDILVTVDLSKQRAFLAKQGQVIESTSISTGREGYSTPAGRYVVTDKHRSHKSTLYHVQMPWFMRLNCSAIGLHSGYVTGRPASHGCIRLPYAMAKKFFELVKVGDEVQIVH